MKSVKDNRKLRNGHRAQVIEIRPPMARIQLLQVERRIFRDWLRGLRMRAIAREYRVPVAEIEDIVREQLTEKVAA